MSTEDKNDHAQKQAKAQLSSIIEMVAALSVDFDRLEELRDKAKEGHWLANWNSPGYLPDNKGARFERWEDARKYLAEQMDEEGEQLLEYDDSNETSAQELKARAEMLRQMEIGVYDEWGATIGRFHWFITKADGLADEDEVEELKELEVQAGEFTSEDEARERIQEDPLEIQIRSGWYAPGETPEPCEFYILLCTGGPAVRLLGELDGNNQPNRVWMEYQDWGTPWTELSTRGGDNKALLTYAQQFYFGE